MKPLAFVACWLFILGVPALFISASIATGFNSQWLYEYGFQKYGVSQSTGLAPAELTKTARALISYFNSGEEYISVTVTRDNQPFQLFTREESIHFKDVKGLVWLDYSVLLVSFLYLLGYALVSFFRHKPGHRRALARSALWGSGVTLAIILVLGIGAALDFNRLFLQFHFLAFTNPYWSAKGYMLVLFPGGFWFDAALFCTVMTAGMAIALAALAAAYLKKERV